MKITKFYILLISILLSAQVFAARTTFKEQADNWLKRTESNTGRPGINEDTPSPEAPAAPPFNGPVGDALAPLLLFALIYGIYCRFARKAPVIFKLSRQVPVFASKSKWIKKINESGGATRDKAR